MTRANIKRIKRGDPVVYKDLDVKIFKGIPKFCYILKEKKYYNLRTGKQVSIDIIMKFKKTYQVAVKKLLMAEERDFTYYCFDILDEVRDY